MPTATDLVTDLPADFEVFGQAVATSMADLLGGTTGQILAKNSATDMDFVWIANDQGDITGITATAPLTGGGSSGAVTVGIQDALTTQKGAVQLSDSTSTTSSILAATPTAVKAAYDLADGAIAKTTVTTAGDIIYRNATVPVRLGIGTAGQVLKVNSGATAPEWGSASSGMTLVSATTFSAVASHAVDSVFTSTYKYYRALLVFTASGLNKMTMGFRASGTRNTSANYYSVTRSTDSAGTNEYASDIAGTTITLLGKYNTDFNGVSFDIFDPQAASDKLLTGTAFSRGSTSGGLAAVNFGGSFNSASAMDGLQLIASSGTISGTLKIYGYQN